MIIINVSYCFWSWYLFNNLNLNKFLYLNFNNLWLIYDIFERYNFLHCFIHVYYFLYYFLCNNRLLDNKLYRNLLYKGNRNLTIFYCDLMNFNYFLNDSISKHFYWNLSDNLSWNFSLNLYCFGYLFLDNYLNYFIFFCNLNVLDNLYFWLININLFNYFYLSNYRDLSDNLNYL